MYALSKYKSCVHLYIDMYHTCTLAVISVCALEETSLCHIVCPFPQIDI